MHIALAIAAIVEALTGLLLLVYPPLPVKLLFSTDIIGSGIVMSRIAGIGLLSLGIACCPDFYSRRPLFKDLLAMVTYNLIVTFYLLYLGIIENMTGLLLWPAIVLHATLSILLGAGLVKTARY